MRKFGGMTQEITAVVLVKAAPVLTSRLEESMCVAAIRVDGDRNEWLRLHPVPFADLDDDHKFVKYQRVTLEAKRPKSDRRPETWEPIHGTIHLGDSLPTSKGWAQRRQLVEQLGETTTCDLWAANQDGSGEGVPSLGVVRPVEPPELLISQRSDEQLTKWRRRAEAKASLQTLFDNPDTLKPKFEVIPWRFQYRYKCAAPGCNRHEQTIVDWEVAALWRHVRAKSNWQDLMRKKLETEMWTNRDSVLFVGNQEQHPNSFLVLGVFWPPAGDVQGALAL